MIMDAAELKGFALVERAPGVFYTSRPFVLADAALLAFLKAAAARTPLRRARLCAHPDPGAAQHDMLIVSAAGTYVAPHRHPVKTESFVVLEGEADCLLFEADGRIADVVRMGSTGSGQPFFYRMPVNRYHSLAIRSEVLVFAESTMGPFSSAATENAPWAPGATETEAGLAFIRAAIERFDAARK
jgi:cupin fold WbuC family metalloprotein